MERALLEVGDVMVLVIERWGGGWAPGFLGLRKA